MLVEFTMILAGLTFEWTVRVTDVLTILAIIAGPILAVQITEYLRKSGEATKRKIHIFRTLMATRSVPLSAAHIESLNLVEIEFRSSRHQERRVVDCWRLYLAHLNDRNYPQEAWAARKGDLLIDLLYEMSGVLGFSYDKSQIKSGTYYPSGWQEAELEQIEARKLWLDVLRGQRTLPMQVFPPPASPAPPSSPVQRP
jgi:hypothetical protein